MTSRLGKYQEVGRRRRVLLAACALQSPPGVKDEEVQDNALRRFHRFLVHIPLLSQ